jgi:tRNA wybutosine-synthesizing protein 2
MGEREGRDGTDGDAPDLPPTAGEGPLAAVVDERAAEATAAALREEGVYDDERRVRPYGDGAVALPVTAPPEAAVRDVVVDEAPEPRATGLAELLRERGFSAAEVDAAPASWAVVGSVVLARFEGCERAEEVGEALLELHGEADTVLDRRGIDGEHREPDVAVVAGAGDTETVHLEHGTRYALDLARVMFSPGNKAERARMGAVVAGEEGPAVETGRGVDEHVLDAFAGVGYFALPMARAGARVTAVERNPAAFRYLLENAQLNDVTDRLEPYRGDCSEVVARLAADGPFADRAVFGHYDAHEHLPDLLPAVRPGGVVHLHEAVPRAELPDRPVGHLQSAADAVGRSVDVLDVREVKSHDEGVAHVVVDARL